MDEVDEFLEHFGVKGQKWGVRRRNLDRISRIDSASTSRKTDKDARKDAQEFARAKSFFGEGAGTRRKLINQTVEAKKKKDPSYAKAFDKHLDLQDQSKHASGARKERKKIDRKDRTKKRAGFIARRVTGEMGTQAAFTAVALGGAAFVSSPKGQAIMKKGISTIKTAAQNEMLRRRVANMLK